MYVIPARRREWWRGLSDIGAVGRFIAANARRYRHFKCASHALTNRSNLFTIYTGTRPHNFTRARIHSSAPTLNRNYFQTHSNAIACGQSRARVLCLWLYLERARDFVRDVRKSGCYYWHLYEYMRRALCWLRASVYGWARVKSANGDATFRSSYKKAEIGVAEEKPSYDVADTISDFG